MSKRHEQIFGGRGYTYGFDEVHMGMGGGSGGHAPDAWHPDPMQQRRLPCSIKFHGGQNIVFRMPIKQGFQKQGKGRNAFDFYVFFKALKWLT